jgi:L-aspartate oxidase
MHGANRLASNAMLEGAVMAAECARALEAPVRAAPLADRPAPDGVPEHAGGEGTGTARIRQVMSQAMGVVRDGDRLARASRELAALDPGTLDADGRSLADVSRLAVAAARLREERRGAHFRRDHERTDPGWERRLAWLGDEPRLVAVRQQVPERSAA